jgi:hypothetical protein
MKRGQDRSEECEESKKFEILINPCINKLLLQLLEKYTQNHEALLLVSQIENRARGLAHKRR